MSASSDPAQTRKDVVNYLRFLKNAGFLYLLPDGDEPHGSPHVRAEQLEAMRIRVSKCPKCPLSRTRKHVVFGEGDPDADIMFVGEAPGANEDEQARPFIGMAGQLLDQMIQEVGLRREDVFIANVLKCRPPDNRDPLPEEIACCEPYLHEQIDLIEPKVIVTLGRFAAHCLTGSKTPVGRMRGKVYLYHDVRLMPTLHPAAVLRNRTQYAGVVEDLRRAVEMTTAS